MATKKECDRCGNQWDPSANNDDAGDTETCHVTVTVPDAYTRSYRRETSQAFELCQKCTGLVLKLATSKNTTVTGTEATNA